MREPWDELSRRDAGLLKAGKTVADEVRHSDMPVLGVDLDMSPAELDELTQHITALIESHGGEYLGVSVPEDHALFQHPGLEPYRLACVRLEAEGGFKFMIVARYRVPNDLGEWDPHNQTVRMSWVDRRRAGPRRSSQA